MYDVFVSYSHADKGFVDSLQARLRSDGVRTFVDTDIEWGESIPRAIQDALDDSKHILCVLSKAYVSSHWTQMERYVATVDDPDGSLRKLLPVLIEDVPLPGLLRPLKYLDCRAPGSLDRVYNSMLKTILKRRRSEGRLRALSWGSPLQNLPRASYANELAPVAYIFIVGHPGAGKSTFAEVLKSKLNAHGLSVDVRSDYPFLQALFRLDIACGRSDRFERHTTAEFRVVDLGVYDEVLRMVHDELILQDRGSADLTVIEFSRPTYDSAFLYYTLKALINSAIVHVEAPLDLCMQRNERCRRTLEARLAGAAADADVFTETPNLHYVPPQVFDRYREAAGGENNQVLVLAMMPSRSYLRLANNTDDIGFYKEASASLIDSEVMPLLNTTESFAHYYSRRLSALNAFLTSAPGIAEILQWRKDSNP